jgi:hypothetical protein
LIDAGLDVDALTIMEVSQGVYTVSSPYAETTEKVFEQVDRDEEHPVVMNGEEVFSGVVSQDGFILTIEIKQL